LTIFIKFKHHRPSKPRLSPHTCLPIAYGAKTQFAPDDDASAILPEDRKRRIQEIVGSLLYYARTVDNKLLVALSAIASRQAQATVATEQAVPLLLDYVATYPNNGIVYRASDMILCAHAGKWLFCSAGSLFCYLSCQLWSRSANLYGAEQFGKLIDYFYAIHFCQ
jgi:hypothetical protein